MNKISKKIKHLAWWSFWYRLKFRKTYETKLFRHEGELLKFKLFIQELGCEGWQIVSIESTQERINGGDLVDYKIIICQRERFINEDDILEYFKLK